MGRIERRESISGIPSRIEIAPPFRLEPPGRAMWAEWQEEGKEGVESYRGIGGSTPVSGWRIRDCALTLRRP